MKLLLYTYTYRCQAPVQRVCGPTYMGTLLGFIVISDFLARNFAKAISLSVSGSGCFLYGLHISTMSDTVNVGNSSGNTALTSSITSSVSASGVFAASWAANSRSFFAARCCFLVSVLCELKSQNKSTAFANSPDD